MARDLDLDFEFQDSAPVRTKRPAAPRDIPTGMPSGRPPMRRKKNQTTSIIILIVEVIVLIALVVLFFILKSKIDDTSAADKAATQTEASAEGGSSGGVNVESNDFTLTCTKVQLANDVDGNPAALIFFTFVNKTDTPLSMAEVYPPSLTQNGASCGTDVVLGEFPTEYTNKDMQVSAGQSVDCCYAFSLSDLTSPLTLTVHDNYSTFTDIGSTEIPIS